MQVNSYDVILLRIICIYAIVMYEYGRHFPPVTHIVERSLEMTSSASDASKLAEPTTEELRSGGWQQPPRTAEVVVPDGVYAKLAQARALYEELTEVQMQAYQATAAFTVTGSDFARQGDMSPETAEVLAKATTSKVFDSIRVYVPAPHLHDRHEAAMIGTIGTVNGVKCYFRLNRPGKGKRGTRSIIAHAHALQRKEWWSEHWTEVAWIAFLVVAIAWPILVAVLTANGAWLVWLVLEGIAGVIWWAVS